MYGFLLRVAILSLVLTGVAWCLFYPPFSKSEAEVPNGVWIRYNKIGYPAKGQKRMIVFWKGPQPAGATWRIDGEPIGDFSSATHSDGNYLPRNMNYKEVTLGNSPCDSIANKFCTHTFSIDGVANANVQYKVYKPREYPYDALITEVINHFKIHRQGANLANLGAGHANDSHCTVRMTNETGLAPINKWSNIDNRGNKNNRANTQHNMAGGWYDAGDYIKFTQTTAYATYVMLRALETRRRPPANSPPDPIRTALEEEAKFGLDYLSRTVPPQGMNYFVIQVSDRRDHDIAQDERVLPGEDNGNRDSGKDPRFCYAAFSPSQMSYTAAALALGARLFNNDDHRQKAAAILNRARAPGNRIVWLGDEDDEENRNQREIPEGFYGDKDAADGLRLAEAEVNQTLGNAPSLALDSIDYASSEVLGLMKLPANSPVGGGTLASAIAARTARLRIKSNFVDNVWKLPATPHFDPPRNSSNRSNNSNNSNTPMAQKDEQRLYEMLGPGFLALRRGSGPERDVGYHVLNYTLGLNNWDISFMRTAQCPDCNSNITYDPIYSRFPANSNLNGMGEIYQGGIGIEEDGCDANENTGNCLISPFSTGSVRFHFRPFNDQTIETSIWGESLAILLFVALDEDDKS